MFEILVSLSQICNTHIPSFFIFTKHFTHLIRLYFPIKRYYQIVFAISSCPVSHFLDSPLFIPVKTIKYPRKELSNLTRAKFRFKEEPQK